MSLRQFAAFTGGKRLDSVSPSFHLKLTVITMLSTQSLFYEIRQNPQAYALLLSIAAKGETQGGWENERIAHLTNGPELANKVRRHGADETKHGLMFTKLLHKAGLDTVAVPVEADYCKLLEQNGAGLPHSRLHQPEKLNTDEFLQYLVHSKITEERASDEVNRLLKVFGKDPDLGPSLKVIADDEINHVSYTHEELLKLSAQNDALRKKIAGMLRDYAQLEIQVYRDVSLQFINHMALILDWSATKKGLLRFGVFLVYYTEKLLTWRRLAALRPPIRPNAMGITIAPQMSVE
jgi:hypothetical protein